MIYLWVQSVLAAGGLSPYERFEAMRKLDSVPRSGLYALLTNKWFVVLGWSVIFVLLLVLAAIRQQRREKNKQKRYQMFEEKANLFGLTMEERDVLYSISQLIHLKNFHNVYFRPTDFETGVTRFLRKTLASNVSEDDKKQQVELLESIKYKIGFVQKNISYKGRYRRGNHLTSRQIPVNEEVTFVSNSLPDDQEEYKATVFANEVTGLGLRTSSPVSFQAGDACTIRYRIGAVLWGFDVIVSSVEGQNLKVCHVDHARYINRRRFVRVPVHQPILVAPFPVLLDSTLKVPSFAKAEIIEFSGATLRIRGSLDVQRKDRVLTIFEAEPGHLVQDIAEVRRVSEGETGTSYILELTGLDDRSENELIRITNRIAIEQGLESEVQDVLDGEDLEIAMEVGGS